MFQGLTDFESHAAKVDGLLHNSVSKKLTDLHVLVSPKRKDYIFKELSVMIILVTLMCARCYFHCFALQNLW